MIFVVAAQTGKRKRQDAKQFSDWMNGLVQTGVTRARRLIFLIEDSKSFLWI